MTRTALITGASSGIGKEIAQLAARDRLDLVLVARQEDKLHALAQELEKAHSVRVHVVAADLADTAAPQRIYDRLQQSGVVVDILVNNAGFGVHGPFLEMSLERQSAMIEVNVQALMKLTHLFAIGMKSRGFGRVLHIASTAGFQSGPYMAVYYATKSFVILFSEALAEELKGTGVTVTCHCPGATATEFGAVSGNDKTRLFKQGQVASVVDVASDAWGAMNGGRVLKIHGVLNLAMMEAQRLGPRALTRKITSWINDVV